MPKISVIIPAYNCADTIESTVDSILVSGTTDCEIILVDDGSNDGTAHICDTLAERNACVRSVHQDNAGVSAARNRGFLEAEGEYIWFVDADDSIKEASIPQLEELLQKHDPDMLVFGMEFDYFHNGRIYRRDELLPPAEGMWDKVACSGKLYELFTANSLSSLCSRVIKRSVMLQMDHLLREEMILYEDLEFVLRVMKHCSSVVFYREAIYRYRQSEDDGNAGRRIKRIPHIPDLLAKISEPLSDEADREKILLALYLTLAREKIKVSGKEEIKTVCSDFKAWIDAHNLEQKIEQREYPLLIYNGQVSKLMRRRTVSKLRHFAANKLKQTIGDFRKW